MRVGIPFERSAFRGACLGRADLEHLRAAFRALALDCGTTVLHLNLDCVFDFALGFALDAIRFCCQLWYLRSALAIPWRPGFPRLACVERCVMEGRERSRVLVVRAEIAAARAGRGFEAAAEGLWLAGELDGPRPQLRSDRGDAGGNPLRPRARAAFRGRPGAGRLLYRFGLGAGDRRRGARGRARGTGADDRRPRRRPPALLSAPPPRAGGTHGRRGRRRALAVSAGPGDAPASVSCTQRHRRRAHRRRRRGRSAGAQRCAQHGRLGSWAFPSLPFRATSIAPTLPAASRCCATARRSPAVRPTSSRRSARRHCSPRCRRRSRRAIRWREHCWTSSIAVPAPSTTRRRQRRRAGRRACGPDAPRTRRNDRISRSSSYARVGTPSRGEERAR